MNSPEVSNRSDFKSAILKRAQEVYNDFYISNESIREQCWGLVKLIISGQAVKYSPPEEISEEEIIIGINLAIGAMLGASREVEFPHYKHLDQFLYDLLMILNESDNSAMIEAKIQDILQLRISGIQKFNGVSTTLEAAHMPLPGECAYYPELELLVVLKDNGDMALDEILPPGTSSPWRPGRLPAKISGLIPTYEANYKQQLAWMLTATAVCQNETGFHDPAIFDSLRTKNLLSEGFTLDFEGPGENLSRPVTIKYKGCPIIKIPEYSSEVVALLIIGFKIQEGSICVESV